MVNGTLPRFDDFIMYWRFSTNIMLAIYNQLQTEYMVILLTADTGFATLIHSVRLQRP
jgi:hypothetical protein